MLELKVGKNDDFITWKLIPNQTFVEIVFQI